MRTTYVLIDYENVQPTGFSLLDPEHCKVILFVGARQDKISVDVAAALQRMGANATYVKVAGSGRNALDFHIAFYAGTLAAAEPHAHLHIVSKDTGFDPLLIHLQSKNISAIRSHNLAELPRLKGAAREPPAAKSLISKTPAEKEALVLSKLLQLNASKPRTAKTLRNTINALFQNGLATEELDSLLQKLQDDGFISLTGGKLAYHLPN